MAASKATEPSAAELELKRRGRKRLVGAITLGLLAIVFLPMIFDSEPRKTGAIKTQEIAVQVPSKEGQPALPPPSVAPVVVPPAAEPAKVAAEPAPVAPMPPAREPSKDAGKEAAKDVAKDMAKAPTPALVEPPKETVKADAKAASKPAEKAKPEPESKSAAAPAADKKGFAVQLGVFSDADNAKHVIERMKDAKLPVYTDKVPIKSGNATRVRVGPYAARDKADAALAQVKLAGADGKVVPLK